MVKQFVQHSDAVMAEISVFGGYYGGIWHQFLAVAEILLPSAKKMKIINKWKNNNLINVIFSAT